MSELQQQNKLEVDEFSKETINTIFLNAIQSRASDIHFEPQSDQLLIRLRIDGILRPSLKIPKNQMDEIISRIKVLSSLNITEHRLPQDGYLECIFQSKTYNIRVSTLPSINGEAIVCRFHNKEDVLMNLIDLGFDSDQLSTILPIITGQAGIVLTTGPTGSGKTNLLYAFLNAVNKEEKNVMTVEDPIEYNLPNIRQTQIKEDIGLTFARVMRSIVRQDPDIVMIGEIRDPETAQMAAQISLIGTLIFSTFHTFDIPALITRFQEMGIANSVIAQAIKAVVSTRLLRKICPSCKTEYIPTPEEKKQFGIADNIHKLYKGKGCTNCQNLGYHGRIGIYEIITFDDEIKNAIMERKTASEIDTILNKKQIKKIRVCAMEKVYKGVTTIDEVIRILGFPRVNPTKPTK